MIARLQIPALTLVVTLLSACAHSPVGLTKAQLGNFTIGVDYGEEELNSFDVLRANFPVKVTNSNAVAGTITDIQWVLRRGGETILSGKVDAVELGAGETKELSVTV